MQEKHIQFYSHILSRNIDLLVHGDWGYPILMFPTSMGRFYQNKDFGLVDSVKDFINSGKIKIYNVDTIDNLTFYGNDFPPAVRIHNYNQYVRFLNLELVPFIKAECNVERIGVGGASFGGYHAANFAFKHPDQVAYLFSMSGAFSIKSFMKGYFDDNVYFNSPEDYIKGQQAWIYNHMKIVLGTSDWDICLAENQNMSNLLNDGGVNHWYDEKKWATHDWPLWNAMFPEYLSAFF
jgi:esterase/lipase superfamily enzyme